MLTKTNTVRKRVSMKVDNLINLNRMYRIKAFLKTFYNIKINAFHVFVYRILMFLLRTLQIAYSYYYLLLFFILEKQL